jgi:hypothetical protein
VINELPKIYERRTHPSGLVVVGIPPNLAIAGSISWSSSQTVSKSSFLMFKAYLIFLLERQHRLDTEIRVATKTHMVFGENIFLGS